MTSLLPGEPDWPVAVVSGAGNGIGRAVARRLAADGYAVAILDVAEPAGRDVTASIQADGGLSLFHAVDIRNRGQIEEAVRIIMKEWGRIDAVVNNAGINSYFDAVSMSDEDWNNTFDIDLRGVWLLCQATLPFLLNSTSASIVNISSIHARLTASGYFPYPAAKAAVEGLTRSLAVDYGRRGVRVNAVAPGWTRTALVEDWLQRQPDFADARARVANAHPLGYIAEPEDVAAAVAFLVRNESRAITGAVIPVDCGLSVGFSI